MLSSLPTARADTHYDDDQRSSADGLGVVLDWAVAWGRSSEGDDFPQHIA